MAGVDVGPTRASSPTSAAALKACAASTFSCAPPSCIAREYPDVIFFVVGTDRICYGGDENYTGGKTFKQWAIEREKPDLSKIVFTGRMAPHHLARLLAASDLHIYLTAPFVLSWSMMDAMSCGAVVLGSRRRR